ncbi:MAG: acyl-CoA desaturase [Acidobacteriota bacterium]|nr:acyl-CoA desaturase [Acidobacteriota bacterium]
MSVERVQRGSAATSPRQIDWLGTVPMVLYHLGCLGVLFTGVSVPAVLLFVAVYWTMMFGITAGFHRYFSHRSFRTSRGFQFVLAFLGTMAAQMGPLWWASHHRRHHRYSDTEHDAHSPRLRGFLWAHVGWIFDRAHVRTDERYVKDWLEYPELRWIDRHRYVPPLVLGLACFLLGAGLGAVSPGLGASGLQLVVWGFFVSTTVCYHVTFCINSVTHLVGRRRFETEDGSRNVALLALLTMGEGWHNNHHRFPSSERHGVAWWEIDLTHYVLTLLSKVKIVWGIKLATPEMIAAAKQRRAA